ncbi:hypothetical protein ANTRET_LOCUS5530 [Anthophora retusa]
MSAEELRSGTAHFLVDTGAEINIIKLKSLDENVRVSLDDSAVVTGITSERLETIGTTMITLHNSPVKFHVVKSTFPLKNDGILGQEYLRQEQAEISFAHNTLVTRSDPIRPFRFIDDNSIEQTTKRRNLKSRMYAIKARTRQPIAIDVINSNLKEGYLPRINNIHGVYIGEAAVSVNNCGVCHVLAINTLEEEAILEIPPQQLIPFEYHNFPEEQEHFDSDSNDRTSSVIVNEIISSDDFTLSTTSDGESETASEVISQKLFPLSKLELTGTPSSEQLPKTTVEKQKVTRSRKKRLTILDPNAIATRTRSKIQTESSSFKPSPIVLRPTRSEHTINDITDDSDSTDNESLDIPKFRQRRSVLPNLEFHSESRMVGSPKIPGNHGVSFATNETRLSSQNLQRDEDKIIELPEIYSSDSNSDDESFKTPNQSKHNFSEISSDEDTTIDQTQILRETDIDSDLENLTLQQRLEQLMNHTDNTLTEKSLKATESPSTLPLGSSTPNVKCNKNSKEGGMDAGASRSLSTHNQNSLGIQITENISPDIETNMQNLSQDLQDRILRTITFSREHLTYYRSHYVHFISSDCHLVTPVSKLLSDLGIINTEILQKSKPKVGQVLITKRGKHNIFSVVVKRNYFDELSRDTLRSGLENLKETLSHLNINTFRMSYFGDFIDTLSQGTLAEMLADIFGDTSIKIVLCREDKLPTYNSYLHDLIIRLTEMQTIAGQNLIQAKEKSKFYYDRKACPFDGEIGDMAYVTVEPRKGKFSRRYHGPYKIVGILEKNNIILEDENGKRFAKHFDKLKLY